MLNLFTAGGNRFEQVYRQKNFIDDRSLKLDMVAEEEQAEIVETANGLEENIITFLQEMVRTPSVNPPGEYEEIHSTVRSKFEDFGWKCETVETPENILKDLGLDPDYPRLNLLAYPTVGDGPTIALNAHLDTVPVDDPNAWNYDPFGGAIEDGRVYGRGSHDSKGRIASYTLAARALEEAEKLPENATIVLAITCDEETGGQAGPGYLLESGKLAPEYAIVEGNCQNLRIGHSGVRHFEVSVDGKASHAGVDPEGGANAILGASKLLQAVEKYADELKREKSEVPGVGSPTAVPGTIEGGVKTNVVPSSCSFTVDHRVPPDYDGNQLADRFSDMIHSVDLSPNISASIETVLQADPYLADPDDRHVRIVQENAEAIFDREFDLIGVRGFSDGRFFSQAGAKTLNFGPGDDQGNVHGVDENISIEQITRAGATVASSIIDLSQDART